MKNIIIVLIFTCLFSQVIPPKMFDDLNISKIPMVMPSIDNSQTNIRFSDYSVSKKQSLGKFSYLKINSSINDNFQIKLTELNLSEDSYIIFWDQDIDCMYGPYHQNHNYEIFPSIMSGNEIIIIYFEPYHSSLDGNFTIESIQSIDNYPYYQEDVIANFQNTNRDRPILMVTGYWPPTNEMLRHFSQNTDLNPNGWQGENWRNLGFDIVSFFPEFNPADCNNCGQGYGDFEVDYQDTSQDFWTIINEVKPSGIITFSRGYNNNSWELESNVYNHSSWVADYTTPIYPTPTPPDNTVLPNHNRGTGLPLNILEETLDNSNIDINCYIDVNGDAGQFLSEFMGYHGMWYHQDNINSDWPCLSGGHIHVGGQLSTRVAKDAAELTIETVIVYLNSIMINIGDINSDSLINIQDVIMLMSFILNGENPSEDIFILADINEDSLLNIQDVVLLINIILD